MISAIGKKILFLVILTTALMAGCSAVKKSVPLLSADNVPPTYKITDNTYWWKCSFRISWPEDTKINWDMDLLLAHAVVSPVLVEHIEDISYWRFHRRAARDATGHQFSFLFYTKPETASLVFSEIYNNSILEQAYEANLIEKVIIDDPNHPLSTNIEDTSDRHWSPKLQRNWPSFIMGVSSLWLGLIEDSMEDDPENYADIHQLLKKYREVDAGISELWRTEGQHALLHHLNAVFGYEPLHIRKNLSF